MLNYRIVETRMVDRPLDRLNTHQLMSHIDFQLRTLVLVAARATRDAGGSDIRLMRTPGLGAWLRLLTALASESALEEAFPTLAHAAKATREEFRQTRLGDGAETGSIKRYRDYLFHGGQELPAHFGEDARRICLDVALRTSDLLAAVLESCEVIRSASKGPDRVLARIDGRTLDLWPLIVADDSADWMIFDHLAEAAAWFRIPGDRRLRELLRDERLIRDLRTHLTIGKADERVSDFIGSVRHDLSAFAPRHADVLHDQRQREFLVEWLYSTSQGDLPREDRFRLGPDDVRQWYSSEREEWVGYQQLLKQISNWTVLRERLIDIAEEAQSHDALHSDYLDADFIQPTFNETDLDSQELAAGQSDLQSMGDQVEGLLNAHGTNTEIVFVQGPAGIGKTRALQSLAIERMADGTSDQPLYLYVQAGSVSLHDLGALVDATISGTRILTADSVRALARNGLLVLVIDGFDELLGGLSYQEPLESLRPWLDALGGRGVLLVSARSSYFYNHYRASVGRIGADLSVGHRVFRLNPWSDNQLDQFMSSAGVDSDVRGSIADEDIDMLRLPFFATVAASAARSGLIQGSRVRIANLLIKSYLAREIRKLESGGPVGLLSEQEIEEFYVNVSELMSEKGVAAADLSFAAEMAIEGADFDDREGLADRLTSLCGLHYDSASSASGTFNFEHEVYFDYFYAKAIERSLPRIASSFDLGLLGRRPIRSWTAELLAEWSAARCGELLTRSISLRGKEHPIRRANCGYLYSALANSGTGHMPRTITAAIFDNLRLPQGIGTIDLTGIEADEIDISHFDGEILRLHGSRARLVIATSESLAPLDIDFNSLPDELSLPNEYLTSRVSMTERISAAGGTVRGAPPRRSTVDLTNDVENFLERLERSSIIKPVVSRDTYLPHDVRMRWATDHASSWKTFVRCLIESDLASIAVIPASGAAAMARLTIRASPRSILSYEDHRAAAFWARVEAQS